MLNIFPIQFLALFAYFILRLFIGGICIYLGLSHYKHRGQLKQVFVLDWFPFGLLATICFAFGEIIIGILFILGAYTQLAALAGIVMSIKMLLMRQWFAHPTIPPKIFYVLFLGASILLFITGAGLPAFDLPL